MWFLSFRKAFLPTLAFVLTVCSTIHAQDPATPAIPGNPTPREPSNTGVYTGREIFVPETPEKKEPEPTARSFSDGFLRNTRKHVGFSLSFSEFYTPNVLESSEGRKATWFRSIQPQLYTNLQKRNFGVRLTYGAAYRSYNKGLGGLNTLTQNGTADFNYTLSRSKATLHLINSLTSTYYDGGSLLETYLPTRYQIEFSPRIYLDGRRQTRNTAAIDFNYSLTRRISMSTTLLYNLLSYGRDLPFTTVLSAGVGASYRLNRWLSFDTRYTHYLNELNQGLPGNNIQGLQFGGLSSKLGRGWVISSGGGIQSTREVNRRSITGSSLVSVSKTSGGTTINLSYQHGYSTMSVGSQVWRGHTASVYIVQKMSRHIGIHGNASYFRGSTLLGGSLADTVYGGTGLDVALQKNFVVSTSFSLVSQKLVNFSPAGTSLHRYNAMVSLNYYLPSFRSENNR